MAWIVEDRRAAKVEAAAGEDGAAEAEAGSANPEAGGESEPAIAEADASDTPVPYTLSGIGEKTVKKLVDAGLDSQETVAAASVDQLAAIPGIGEKTAEKILAAARGEATE